MWALKWPRLLQCVTSKTPPRTLIRRRSPSSCKARSSSATWPPWVCPASAPAPAWTVRAGPWQTSVNWTMWYEGQQFTWLWKGFGTSELDPNLYGCLWWHAGAVSWTCRHTALAWHFSPPSPRELPFRASCSEPRLLPTTTSGPRSGAIWPFWWSIYFLMCALLINLMPFISDQTSGWQLTVRWQSGHVDNIEGGVVLCAGRNIFFRILIVIMWNYFSLTVLCRCPLEVVTWPWHDPGRGVEAAAGHITGWQGNDYIHTSRTTADCYLCTYSYIVLLPCHVRLLVSTHPATYTDRPMRRRKVKLCV